MRPFLIFGPQQVSDGLIPSVVRACTNNEEVLLTPGDQTRDFIFIDDLCQMILRILKNPALARGKVYNLCSGVPRNVKEVATAIQKIVGRGELRFGALPYRTNEKMHFYGSTERYSQDFKRFDHTDFVVALEKTIRVAS